VSYEERCRMSGAVCLAARGGGCLGCLIVGRCARG
jgi:hypothetical protein